MDNQNSIIQRTSTFVGVHYAKSVLNATWILKLRSDYVFRRPDFMMWLCAMQNENPISNSSGGRQRGRMAIGTYGTSLKTTWGPYHFSDHWTFGHVDDMLRWYTLDDTVWGLELGS